MADYFFKIQITKKNSTFLVISYYESADYKNTHADLSRERSLLV